MSYINTALRRQVVDRAGNCCEYCHINQEDSFFSFEVDHVIAEKHGGTSTEDNLCLSCPDCNRRHKGSDIGSIDSETGNYTGLYNPRKYHWDDHFKLESEFTKAHKAETAPLEVGFHPSGWPTSYMLIKPLTAEGRVTVFLLRLNDPERAAFRFELHDAGRYPCQPE